MQQYRTTRRLSAFEYIVAALAGIGMFSMFVFVCAWLGYHA